MPTIAVNGTELFYERTGAQGPPLVLVHGSWGDHHNFDAVVPALAQSYRVLTYDRRGHSESPRPRTPGSLREDAMDLAALLEALDLAPAHVVGNSFGASTSLRLATERPELFRSLTAHEPPLFGLLADDPLLAAPLATLGEHIAVVYDRLAAGDAEGGARQFVETVAFGPGMWETLPVAARANFVRNAHTFLDEGQDPEWSVVDLDALRRFPRPFLLTRSDRSPPLFPAVVARIARAVPQGRQHLFAGAGHVPHATHPAAWLEVVGSFLNDAAGAPDPAQPASDRRPSVA